MSQHQRFSIRKYKKGIYSALLGTTILLGGNYVAEAEETTNSTVPDQNNEYVHAHTIKGHEGEVVNQPIIEAPNYAGDNEATFSFKEGQDTHGLNINKTYIEGTLTTPTDLKPLTIRATKKDNQEEFLEYYVRVNEALKLFEPIITNDITTQSTFIRGTSEPDTTVNFFYNKKGNQVTKHTRPLLDANQSPLSTVTNSDGTFNVDYDFSNMEDASFYAVASKTGYKYSEPSNIVVVYNEFKRKINQLDKEGLKAYLKEINDQFSALKTIVEAEKNNPNSSAISDDTLKKLQTLFKNAQELKAAIDKKEAEETSQPIDFSKMTKDELKGYLVEVNKQFELLKSLAAEDLKNGTTIVNNKETIEKLVKLRDKLLELKAHVDKQESEANQENTKPEPKDLSKMSKDELKAYLVEVNKQLELLKKLAEEDLKNGTTIVNNKETIDKLLKLHDQLVKLMTEVEAREAKAGDKPPVEDKEIDWKGLLKELEMNLDGLNKEEALKQLTLLKEKFAKFKALVEQEKVKADSSVFNDDFYEALLKLEANYAESINQYLKANHYPKDPANPLQFMPEVKKKDNADTVVTPLPTSVNTSHGSEDSTPSKAKSAKAQQAQKMLPQTGEFDHQKLINIGMISLLVGGSILLSYRSRKHN
ncbi:YSIRK-type signal peptide-containing protein [Staphylococcus massiliensis]|uniref:YSIRK-type signal peptide-containing protein n=1 Tax=Staphylococcus massiliensis TaxID=555791 RepID=UPI001EDF2005|nr:YSIRK-type signal peptide-containing protein [Staphylococcus massiliensis]MCG3398874.1 YSIRK-type signal peptide-containing protein [Staphylococcus massiliensis]